MKALRDEIRLKKKPMISQELRDRSIAPVWYLKIEQIFVNGLEDALVAEELRNALLGRPRVQSAHRDRVLVWHPSSPHVLAQRVLVGNARLVHEVRDLGEELVEVVGRRRRVRAARLVD